MVTASESSVLSAFCLCMTSVCDKETPSNVSRRLRRISTIFWVSAASRGTDLAAVINSSADKLVINPRSLFNEVPPLCCWLPSTDSFSTSLKLQDTIFLHKYRLIFVIWYWNRMISYADHNIFLKYLTKKVSPAEI